MKRYLLDAGPAQDCIFYRRGIRERIVRERQKGARIGICIPTLGEVIAGIEGSDTRDQNEEVVRRNLNLLVLWPYDRAAAYEFGRIYNELKRRGRPIQQIDMQLAAIARTLGACTIVSSDSDFDAIPDLSVENWSNG
jgi:tRNA(fMet)-specific endonuclease VapC